MPDKGRMRTIQRCARWYVRVWEPGGKWALLQDSQRNHKTQTSLLDFTQACQSTAPFPAQNRHFHGRSASWLGLGCRHPKTLPLICPSWPLGTLYPSVQEEQGCNVVRISAWVRFLCEARLAKCFLGIKAQLPSQVRSSAAGNVISDSSYRRGLGKRRWAGVTSLRAIPYSRTDIINDRDE
jgi:hypothetical protein